MKRHTFAAAERFILSREFFGMKLGLQNISEFLDSIGRPQDQFSAIHIAGTNGKGSTAAVLEAILREQGYRTGLFTSPHLVSLRERVRIDGQPVGRRNVISFVDRFRKILVKKNSRFLRS